MDFAAADEPAAAGNCVPGNPAQRGKQRFAQEMANPGRVPMKYPSADRLQFCPVRVALPGRPSETFGAVCARLR